MRLFRLAALEAVVFGIVILGSYGILRWKHPAPPPEGEATPIAVETVSATETVPDHSETIPEEPEAAAPPAAAYPAIDPKRFLGRDLQVTPYEVKMGENYWSVAKKFNIDVPTLIGANPEMPFVSRINQPLLVPGRKGVLHAVAKGEDLKSIAQLYNVKIEDLKKWNNLSWWHGLKEGDVVFVPDVKPVRMSDAWKDYFSKRGMFGMPFASWGKGWSSKFGYRSDPLTGEKRLHKGMDFRAKYGVSVFASATGRVIFAGVSGGYGNLIQIAHANGYLTFYGHLSKILVHQGQHVHRGQLIGKVGATGRVTGPHLHFEIRKNGKAINPLPLI